MERVLDEKSWEVELVLLTFKDHYIGRADMYHIKRSLQEEFVFCNSKLTFGAIRLVVQELNSGANSMRSGLITKNTKVQLQFGVLRDHYLLTFSSDSLSISLWQGLSLFTD